MRFIARRLLPVASLWPALAFAANVAIVGGDFYTPDLANGLTTAGNTVTVLNAPYTAASLSSYALVIQDGNPEFSDLDALALYVQNGGRLLLIPWAGDNYSVPKSLRSIANNDNCDQYNTSSPGITILSSSDPLLTGSAVPTAAGATNVGRLCDVGFSAGATEVLDWADGTAMLGYRSFGSGVAIQLNLHLITSDTAYQVADQPWAVQIVENAITVPAPPTVSEVSAVPVPTASPAALAAMLVMLALLGAYTNRRRR